MSLAASVNSNSTPDLSLSELRAARMGLALGGGAARGFAHIGFLEEISRAGLRPCCIAGCSIGAFIGAAYAGGHWEQFVQRALGLQWLDLLGMMDPVLPRCGLMDGDKALEFLAGFLRVANLEDCTPPLAVNATDAQTGDEVVFTSGPIIPAVRASIALPGIFTPAKHGRQLLLDGGLINPLPVSLCRQMDADIVVAVDLNAFVLEAENYAEDDNFEDPAGMPEPANRFNLLQGLASKIWSQTATDKSRDSSAEPPPLKNPSTRRLLGFFTLLVNSIYIMQRTLNRMRLEKEPPDFLIQPELRDVRLMDFHKGPVCSAAGARAARKFLQGLRSQKE